MKVRITKEIGRQLTSKMDMRCMDGIPPVPLAYIANKEHYM